MRRTAFDQVTTEQLRELAVAQGACIRPVLQRVTDSDTGDIHTVAIPCGSTREAVCPSCAKKARALRMQQCREGWHLTDDPLPREPDEDDQGDHEDEGARSDADDEPEQPTRRVRSTRRRQDAPNLPKLPVEHRTLGRTFTG
ncbi:MAG: replication initiator, partial [Nocardioidaceae bacterium]